MAEVELPPGRDFDMTIQTLIVGGGACGMVAALAAHEAGQEVLVVEADALATGSTALSAGLIPAAGTAQQRDAGIADDPEIFAADIRAKAKGQNDPDLEHALAHGAGPVMRWLTETHGLPFSVVTDFDYPGHARRRMHGLPTRSGAELVDALRSACERQGIQIACSSRAETLYAKGSHVFGLALRRPDGMVERIGCDKLILACNGFGGNRDMVAAEMPDVRGALWFGHDGNKGEAVQWGRKLGAKLTHLGAYQGHGNVAHPQGILISWAVITQGGVQVNAHGVRFWDESQGYSEAARAVLNQPGGIAFTVFDARIAQVARQFEDFRNAEKIGAFVCANSVTELAKGLGVPDDALAREIGEIPTSGSDPDRFGRVFAGSALSPPYWGVKVTGALFHTQGGLGTDGSGRVQREDGGTFDNLFAGGGAACGVSGTGDSGYLSGNGLLAAVVLGFNAGRAPVTWRG